MKRIVLWPVFILLLAACNTSSNGNSPKDTTVNDLQRDPGGKVNDTGTGGTPLDPAYHTKTVTDSAAHTSKPLDKH